ncbi:MAG: hypothetical protein WDZ51_16510 [Pirellulaceae bacterium]
MAQQQSSDWQPRREAQPLSSTSGQRMILRLRDLRVARTVEIQQPPPSEPETPAPRPTIQPPEKSISWLEEIEAAEESTNFTLDHPPAKPDAEELRDFADCTLGDHSEEEDLDQLSLLPPGQSIPPISLIPDSAPVTETAPQASARHQNVTPRPERQPARPAADPDREQRRVAILRGAWLNRAYITGISATILLATYLILNGFGSQRPEAASKLDDSLFTFEDDLPSSKLNEAPAWSPLKESETVVTSEDSYVPRFDAGEDVPFLADRPSRDATPLSNPRLSPGNPTMIVGPTDREPVTNSPAAQVPDGYQPSFAPPSNDLDDLTPEDTPQYGFAGGIVSDKSQPSTETTDQASRNSGQDSSSFEDHWARSEPNDSAEPRNPAGSPESTFSSDSTRSWEMPSTERTPPTSDNNGWLDNSQSAAQASPRRTATPNRDWGSLNNSSERNDMNNVPSNQGESYVDRNTVQNPYVQQSVQQPAGYPTIESYEPYPPQGPRQAELLGIEPLEPEIRR